jgi:hypothetical protein
MDVLVRMRCPFCKRLKNLCMFCDHKKWVEFWIPKADLHILPNGTWIILDRRLQTYGASKDKKSKAKESRPA